MNYHPVPNATGESLGALILREARRRGISLTVIKLSGLTYYVYGWGIVHLDLSLSGFERLKCLAFGPCFQSLLDRGLPFGNGPIDFEKFSPPGLHNLETYDRIPRALDIVHQMLALDYSEDQLWNSTHSSERDPWVQCYGILPSLPDHPPEIQPDLVNQRFLEIESQAVQ